MEGTEINWARSVFSNLMEMVRPDSDRSWGYAVQLGKIFLHLKIKVGPGVGILKRSIIRSRHFLPRKQSASSSTGGRKKKAAKKNAPAKASTGGKRKEKVIFEDPPQQTEDEEWDDEEADTEGTENRTDHDDDLSARSPTDAEQSFNPETTEVAPRVLDKLEKGKLEIRQEIERLEVICNQKEVPVYTAPVIEEFPIDWTTTSREDTETPRDIETPIQDNAEIPTSKTVEVQSLEDVEVPNSEIEVINLEDSAQLEPPNEEEAPINPDERADPNPTEQSPPTPPPEATVSVPPKEWIEDRLQEFEASVSGRIGEQLKKFEVSTSGQVEDRLQKFEASISEQIDDRILNHNVSKLQPLKDRCENIFDTAMQFADVTKQERLDAEVSRDKEAPRATQLTEEEIEAERIRRAELLYPGYAEQLARQAAADAERLETEQRRLAGFAKEHEKKKKAAASVSAPAASASEPKKRKKPASKKVRIVETLNTISELVETGTSQQADPEPSSLTEKLLERLLGFFSVNSLVASGRWLDCPSPIQASAFKEAVERSALREHSLSQSL
ncbi:fibrous sheath CABYR-binding protein-like [Impatiens glandulifera]|uniref:fibrous sheath CABYR-binding protein-like n=1 Tax=Impatiens glandulifera TaxID=253017 RepID=UPI001FB1860C|nr:fibrous sheath CABYR-binding protein-like [Impatiens glandulifera]